MKAALHEILNKINRQMARLKMPLLELKNDDSISISADCYIQFFNKMRPVEYKKTFRLAQIPIFLEQSRKSKPILFTDYLQPSVADALLSNGIEFADTAGNLFLKNAASCILIQNCKKPQELAKKEIQGRAFTASGLKVLFLFLSEADALQWNYRKIHEYTGVSLGNIQYVMKDLQEKKYIVNIRGRFHMPDRLLLLERWTSAYIDRLHEKCEAEKYEGSLSQDLDKFPVCLTGESAASELRLMNASKIVMYRWGNINELIIRNRWKKNNEGNIEVRTAFWPEIRTFKPLAPYLLIYADLLAENDSRCMETAKLIYDKYLKEQPK